MIDSSKKVEPALKTLTEWQECLFQVKTCSILLSLYDEACDALVLADARKRRMWTHSDSWRRTDHSLFGCVSVPFKCQRRNAPQKE